MLRGQFSGVSDTRTQRTQFMHERSSQTAAPVAVKLPGLPSTSPSPIFSCSEPAGAAGLRCRTRDLLHISNAQHDAGSRTILVSSAGQQADGGQAGRKTAPQMLMRGSASHRLSVRIALVNWWSYGDSNPRPLACHETPASSLNRPYAARTGQTPAHNSGDRLTPALPSGILPLKVPPERSPGDPPDRPATRDRVPTRPPPLIALHTWPRPCRSAPALRYAEGRA